MSQHDELFRDICENAHDLIQSVAPDGRFLYVNRAWLRTLGYSKREVAKLNVMDVIHPDSRDHCAAALQQLLAGEPVREVEADFQAKDGRRIPVEGLVSCRFENGKPVSTRGIFRDVTVSKHAEEELDRLFHLSLDLMCVAGTDGYFRRINPAFERVLGYSKEELLSRAFVEFVHPDDRASTLAEVENLAAGRPVVDFKNRYRARDGAYRWLAWRAAPLASQGLIYATARDITEEKKNQEVMARQAAELARSNADLEQFAYVASHDLRAPMRAVANLTDFIEEDLGDTGNGKVRDHLRRLKSRVQRTQTLIDDLLRYSRVGREEEAIERVDTAALVRELTALFAPPEGLVVTVAPDLPVFETAKAPLEQVLRNLIGNAIKYHDRPRGRVEVASRDRGAFYEFLVRDDGPGIPEDSHERIFHMFQKLESRDEVEGTGMGLALVKRIVENHGGTIGVDSTAGRGATFRFTWPKKIDVPANPG